MLRALQDILLLPRDIARGAAVILSSRRLLGWCIVPWIIGCAAFVISAAALSSADDALPAALGLSADGWFGALVGVVGAGLSLIGAAIIAVVAMLVLGGFFFEFMVEELLRMKQLTPATTLRSGSSVARFCRSLRDDLVRLVVFFAIAVVAFGVSFVPPLLIISVLLGAFAVGFDLLDVPLVLLEARFKDRWRLTRRHTAEVLVMGGAAMCVVPIPVVNLIALPIFYVIAVERLTRWEADLRELAINASSDTGSSGAGR